MRKKIILFTTLLLLITGCGGSNFQIGELKLEAGFEYTTVEGDIKNTSNKECNNMKLIMVFKNGDIEIEEKPFSTYHDLKIDEIYHFEYYNFDKSYEGYTPVIKKIECE